MAVYADIQNGTCINVIVLDPDDEAEFAALFPDDVFVEIDTVPGSPGIGWQYDGTTWSPPTS